MFGTSAPGARSQQISSPISIQSDDDILHVVTNVYQIPIIRGQATDGQPLTNSATIQIPTVMYENEPRIELQSKTTKSSVEKHQYIVHDNNGPSTPVKSKYQVRSIVEIYENPQAAETIDIGSYRKSAVSEEIHTHKTFPADSSDLSSNGTIPIKGKNHAHTRTKTQIAMYFASLEPAPYLIVFHVVTNRKSCTPAV
jgi:hypothetical protein